MPTHKECTKAAMEGDKKVKLETDVKLQGIELAMADMKRGLANLEKSLQE
jgi:hypothetical protein